MAKRLPHTAQVGFSPNKKKKIVFVVGPTAVGKSEIAVKLAVKIKGEIVSCDSMQVYRKMNIITQRPNPVLTRQLRHHLMGILSPKKEYSVADYQKQADAKINDILNRGKVPVFVGGTGFYMSVLLDGIFKEGKKNQEFRDRLQQQARRYGKKRLYERLTRVDPVAASRIHLHDLRRMVRALEVYESTGIPITELKNQRKGILDGYEVKIFCLNRQRDELYKRINQRVEDMFKQGLVKEVKGLLGVKLGKTASQAIGIKEIKGYLNGEYGLEEAKRLMKRNSRHYAKRQLSWFRQDKRIEWFFIRTNQTPKEVAERLWKRLC